MPYRETPRNAITKIGKGGLDARPRKTFFITFLKSPYREALNQRNNKKLKEEKVNNFLPEKKIAREKYFPGKLLGKVLNFFSNSPHRENAQTTEKQIGVGFRVELLVKTFRRDVFCILQNVFLCVF
jgi:hypothetical protein